MEKTLLQKAKETPMINKNGWATEEEIELALAWAKGEISLSQVMAALDSKSASVAY